MHDDASLKGEGNHARFVHVGRQQHVALVARTLAFTQV